MSETTPSKPNITVNDVRDCGFCVRGAKEWFELHGLDFRKFLAEGIDTDSFLATNDEMAQIVVDRRDGKISERETAGS